MLNGSDQLADRWGTHSRRYRVYVVVALLVVMLLGTQHNAHASDVSSSSPSALDGMIGHTSRLPSAVGVSETLVWAMVGGESVPNVTVVSTSSTVSGYSDIPADHFAALDIATLAADGVLDGTDCDKGQFCPDVAIQRWQVAVWIVRVLDGADPEVKISRFDDIPGDPWWETYVERLAELGVTVGCRVESDSWSFCPTDVVSRAQMAAFLDRAFDLPEAFDVGFIDTDGVFSARAIDRLYQSGITYGCSDIPLRFCPKESVTRAQMAAFLQRARPAPTLEGFGPDDESRTDPAARPRENISDVVMSVHYCGPPGSVTEADLRDEVAKLKPLETFFSRESGGAATLTIEVGDVHVPAEATNPTTWANETTAKWHDNFDQGNPCYDIVSKNLKASAGQRHVALILPVLTAGNEADDSLLAYGSPGSLFSSRFVPHAIVQPSGVYGSTASWQQVVAHETGHAAYALCHTFEAKSTCVTHQGTNEDVKKECTREEEAPDCGDNKRLEELAGSVMSYYRYGSYVKLSDSYVSCEQKNWLGWHERTCGTPSAPREVVAVSADSRLMVRWTPPRDNGWSPITGYYIRIAETRTDQSTIHGPFTGVIHTVLGLTNGTRYTVDIQAINNHGGGDWSVPEITKPEMHHMAPAVPRVEAVVSGGVIRASWSADDNGSRIDKWEIDGVGEVSATTTSYVWRDQSPGSYVVRVRAHNEGGWSRWGESNIVTVQAPSVAAYDAGTAVGNRFDWDPSKRSHAACENAVVCRNVGVSNLEEFDGPPYRLECWVEGQREADWSGLWSGRTDSGCYWFAETSITVYVKINGVESNRVVLQSLATIRSAVPRVEAVVSGGVIRASWSADDNGSRIDKWEIDGVGEVSATTTSYVWRDQSPGSYVVRVRAHNEGGWSRWGESNIVTVQAPSVAAYDAGTAVGNRFDWDPSKRSHAACENAVVCRNVGVSNLEEFDGPPYRLECWVEGQREADWSGLWSGRTDSGCYWFAETSITVYVKINGVESNIVVLRSDR